MGAPAVPLVGASAAGCSGGLRAVFVHIFGCLAVVLYVRVKGDCSVVGCVLFVGDG